MANVNAYIKGRPAPDVHESHHHLMPIKTYMGVFGALMVLTVITVLVSYADLGPAALPVAMAVALVKAGFVVGYFMHLKFDTRFHTFVFLSTLLFVGIFFALTYLDLNTRATVNANWDSKGYARDAALLEKPAPEEVPIEPAKLEELRAKAKADPHAAEGGAH
jgi:caa(3)-type oxidase subunit IV